MPNYHGGGGDSVPSMMDAEVLRQTLHAMLLQSNRKGVSTSLRAPLRLPSSRLSPLYGTRTSLPLAGAPPLPIMAGGMIYLFDENGKGTVLAAERNFKVISTNELEAGCMGSPAVSGDMLIVRTKKALYGLRNQ